MTRRRPPVANNLAGTAYGDPPTARVGPNRCVHSIIIYSRRRSNAIAVADVGVCGWSRQFIKPRPVIGRRTRRVYRSDGARPAKQIPRAVEVGARPGRTRLAHWSEDRPQSPLQSAHGRRIRKSQRRDAGRRIGSNDCNRRRMPLTKNSVIRLAGRRSLSLHGRRERSSSLLHDVWRGPSKRKTGRYVILVSQQGRDNWLRGE